MRIMRDDRTGQKFKVVEHIILRNFWEYYVLKVGRPMKDIKTCLVMGAEQEIGDVYMPEIAPYVMSRTTNLMDVMPAAGWSWVDSEQS